jgi:single-strand DNA-binding protein
MSTSATLIFRGRLGNDPQLRTTQTGEPVANFNLAIDQGYGERKTTAWVRVVVWGKQAEACSQHLGKGDLVEVHSQRFQVSVWTAQDNSPQGQLEVTARRVDFILTKRGQPQDTSTEEDMPF